MPATAAPILAVLSVLHEGPTTHAAARRFRGDAVLGWTLRRLAACDAVHAAAVVCWDDQLAGVQPVADRHGATVLSQGPRVRLPHVDAVAAARRWADGWRGGPLGTSAFDPGFHGPAVRAAAEAFDASAVVLVDASAALVDPALVAAVVGQWRDHPERDFAFAPAATGLGCMLLAKPLVDRIAAAPGAHPGRLLHYFPDQLSREPLADERCAPVPVPVARSPHRYTVTGDRQARRLDTATADLNGQLVATGAEGVVARVNAAAARGVDPLPREVVLELTTRRATAPIYSPLAAGSAAAGSPAAGSPAAGAIDRPDLDAAVAARLFDELSALDDARLTLAGVGDPLLHPAVFDLIARAADRGVAVNVETDLLADAASIARLAESPADVVSVHLPALTAATYAAVMGRDAYGAALGNVQALVTRRAALGKGTPLVVPLFAKCRQNLHEMEAWYDQWLRAVGTAVVLGPSTYAGLIPDVAVADMQPPRRSPCRRIADRLTVLSDGTFAPCEQDVLGRQPMGRAGTDALSAVWQAEFAALRKAHADGRWCELSACSKCSEWHRP
ncbi:MAG TPA: SPASM domain-containing protein [Humisphaera sp.]